MKKRIILVGMVIMALAIVGYVFGTRKEIKELKSTMSSYQKNNENAISQVSDKIDKINEKSDKTSTTQTTQATEAQNDDKNRYQEYVDMQFPKDGKTYVVSESSLEDSKFYSDVNCSIKIETPEFCSSNIQSGEAPNTLSIYCFRTVDDTIVYSPEYTYLVEKTNK